jgi:hypothetical protein
MPAPGLALLPRFPFLEIKSTVSLSRGSKKPFGQLDTHLRHLPGRQPKQHNAQYDHFRGFCGLRVSRGAEGDGEVLLTRSGNRGFWCEFDATLTSRTAKIQPESDEKVRMSCSCVVLVAAFMARADFRATWYEQGHANGG